MLRCSLELSHEQIDELAAIALRKLTVNDTKQHIATTGLARVRLGDLLIERVAELLRKSEEVVEVPDAQNG